ncbi:MAG: GlxA family transcriptional regulator [Neomegalonema sp.]
MAAVENGERPLEADRLADDDQLLEVGFLLIHDFALYTLSSAIDVLRHANRFAGRRRYLTRVYTEDGDPAMSSNRLEIKADRALEETARPWKLFVVCGFHPERVTDDKILGWLRKVGRRGTDLGGISAGAFVLARAGLLEGYECAVHWEYAGAFEEMWPDVALTDRLYVIDRDRQTCAGGAATVDMFLRIVADDLGPDIAAKAAEQMLVDRVRTTLDRQTSAALFRAKSRSGALAEAIEAMEHNLDAPLSMIEIATPVGLTRRQLHRLFREHTGQSPTDFYRDIRLRYARNLLRQTPSKVIDVALASGFGSHSHFSKVYREHFGVSPLKDRRSDL